MRRGIAFLIFLLILAGCTPGGEHIAHPPLTESESLLFHRVQTDVFVNVSPAPAAFFHELTAEQMEQVFPYFDLPLIAHAYYEADGRLMEVSASVPLPESEEEWWQRANIHIGINYIRFDFSGPSFNNASDSLGLPRNLEESNIHGTLVRAVILENDWSETRHFQAEFEFGNIFFRVKFEAEEEAGKAFMTTIVNNLVLGGTEGLSSLADPVIPELRSEAMSLEEARLDPDFGHLVPSDAPDPFHFQFGHRSISQHWNILHLEWEAPWDPGYLARVYESWAAGRSANTPPFEFDRIFWGELSVRWIIGKAEEHDFLRVVSIHEPENYDLSLYPLVQWEDHWLRFHEILSNDYIHNPVFLAEEITFEAVASREWRRVYISQGADGEEHMDMRDVFIPLEAYELEFSVLFGNVIVNIHTQGLTAEQVWVMLEKIL